jgi:thiaminase (transcriptional activator TenA)
MDSKFLSFPSSAWSHEAQQQVKPILAQIRQLPFIKALGDGSLAPDKFRFYLQQDVLYLRHYSRIMRMIADRCTLASDAEQFRRFSSETIKAEQYMQQNLLQNNLTAAQQIPSCLLYTAFLYQQLITEPLPVAIASTLACFYIYQQVGEHLLARADIHSNPYLRWIETYNYPEYCRDGAIAMNIADRLAISNSTKIRTSMLHSFLIAAKLEKQLWHNCWQMSSWPL